MTMTHSARFSVLVLALLLTGLPAAAGAGSLASLAAPSLLDAGAPPLHPLAPSGGSPARLPDGQQTFFNPPAESSPEPDLALLRELASFQTKAELSEADGDRLVTIVEQLGDRHRVRRLVARILNRDGGRLDRMFNKVLIARAWKKHGPLPNLAEVSSGIVRGGQPAPEGWAKLKAMGVQVVVNLRLEDESERSAVEARGLRYVSMPIPDTDAPTREQARRFLQLCGETTSQARLFFHCAAGTFRTGTMAAVYRVEQGATAEQALAEAATFGWRETWLNADLEAAFVRRWAGKGVRPH